MLRCPEKMNDRLRPMAMMPSVTTKGARPKTATSTPERSPMPAPAAMASGMAIGIGRICSACARMMPVSPKTAPTLRSMPPVRMTKVMPTATMPMTTDWSRMLKMLRSVRK